MTVSSSGDGVWPTRGAETSGLKCGRKRAADRGEDGGRLGCRNGGEGWGNNTQVGESRQVETLSCKILYIHQSDVFVEYMNGVNTKNDQLAVSTTVIICINPRQDEKTMTVIMEQTLLFHI